MDKDQCLRAISAYIQLADPYATMKPFSNPRGLIDEIGKWAFHCHLLFHMEHGAFRVVSVLDPKAGGRA